MRAAHKPMLVREPTLVTTATKNEQALVQKLREQELLYHHASLLIEAEGEGMAARRQGMLDRANPYNMFAVDANQREISYSWLSGWETCDEEMKSLNVLTTARDFADAVDLSQLDEHCKHLFRIMQHALREARSLTE
jgi:hypothetical protein